MDGKDVYIYLNCLEIAHVFDIVRLYIFYVLTLYESHFNNENTYFYIAIRQKLKSEYFILLHKIKISSRINQE